MKTENSNINNRQISINMIANIVSYSSNLLISFGSTPDLFSQERVAPPLVSSAKKLMPQAQAYSRLGYRKNAVLPTPDAPIIRK